MSTVVKLWEKFSDGRTACYWHRDRAGFCLLTNRCWNGKSCPRTQGMADKYFEQVCDEAIAMRASSSTRTTTDG